MVAHADTCGLMSARVFCLTLCLPLLLGACHEDEDDDNALCTTDENRIGHFIDAPVHRLGYEILDGNGARHGTGATDANGAFMHPGDCNFTIRFHIGDIDDRRLLLGSIDYSSSEADAGNLIASPYVIAADDASAIAIARFLQSFRPGPAQSLITLPNDLDSAIAEELRASGITRADADLIDDFGDFLLARAEISTITTEVAARKELRANLSCLGASLFDLYSNSITREKLGFVAVSSDSSGTVSGIVDSRGRDLQLSGRLRYGRQEHDSGLGLQLDTGGATVWHGEFHQNLESLRRLSSASTATWTLQRNRKRRQSVPETLIVAAASSTMAVEFEITHSRLSGRLLRAGAEDQTISHSSFSCTSSFRCATDVCGAGAAVADSVFYRFSDRCRRLEITTEDGFRRQLDLDPCNLR